MNIKSHQKLMIAGKIGGLFVGLIVILTTIIYLRDLTIVPDNKIFKSALGKHLAETRIAIKNKERTITILSHRPKSFKFFYDFINNPKKEAGRNISDSNTYYKKLIQFYPNDADAYAMRGYCLYYSRQTEEAIDHYTKSIELNPRYFWSYYNLGLIYYKNKEFQKAADHLQKAFEAKNDDIVETINKSRVYQQIIAVSSNPQRHLVTSYNSGYQDGLRLLVLSYKHLNKYQEIAKTSNAALSSNIDPEGFFSFHLGESLYKLRNYEKAAQFLQQSVQRNPNNSENYRYLSLTFNAVGQTELSQQMSALANEAKAGKNEIENVDEIIPRFF